MSIVEGINFYLNQFRTRGCQPSDGYTLDEARTHGFYVSDIWEGTSPFGDSARRLFNIFSAALNSATGKYLPIQTLLARSVMNNKKNEDRIPTSIVFKDYDLDAIPDDTADIELRKPSWIRAIGALFASLKVVPGNITVPKSLFFSLGQSLNAEIGNKRYTLLREAWDDFQTGSCLTVSDDQKSISFPLQCVDTCPIFQYCHPLMKAQAGYVSTEEIILEDKGGEAGIAQVVDGFEAARLQEVLFLSPRGEDLTVAGNISPAYIGRFGDPGNLNVKIASGLSAGSRNPNCVDWIPGVKGNDPRPFQLLKKEQFVCNGCKWDGNCLRQVTLDQEA